MISQHQVLRKKLQGRGDLLAALQKNSQAKNLQEFRKSLLYRDPQLTEEELQIFTDIQNKMDRLEELKNNKEGRHKKKSSKSHFELRKKLELQFRPYTAKTNKGKSRIDNKFKK